MPRRAPLLTLVTCLLLVPAAALPELPPTEEKASLAIDADRTAYAPGEAGRLAAIVRIDDGWHVNSHRPTYEYLIATTLTVELPAGWEPARLSYPEGRLERFTFAEEPLSVYQGEAPILVDFRVPRAAAPEAQSVRLGLTYQACNDRVCLPPVQVERTMAVRVGAGEPSVSGFFARGSGRPPAMSRGAQPVRGSDLLWMLALGLLGGLILNAMPCVLPVLSIKVFSLVKHSTLTRAQVATAGVATTLGILASFWTLATAAVLARRAGAAVGWGLHFQQPAFVALLAVVVVLFTLNMWGIFEIRLPGRLADAAGGGVHEGVAGHFVTGLFATLMATPCSAPFLGTAVGFALGQPAPTVLAVFTAVGLGMASPYLLLAAWPGAARLLPRPGTWMVRLKEVMGFLLAGTAVWLFYVLAQQVSAEALALVQLGLLVLSLAVWLGRSARPGWPLATAIATVLVTAGATVWVAAEAPPARRGVLAQAARGLIPWEPFERARAERLAAEGTPVFVDVTAEWCVTCKVNERLVLDTPEVAGEFRRLGVVAMKADWTTRDRAIGDFLAEHGRYGIPFYVLYRPGGERHVFPELITRDLVVGALAKTQQAAR